MKIWFDPGRCRGCLRCELACSYHQSGHRSFQPDISSTKIYRSNENKSVTMTLNDTCNQCRDEKRPLCVSACVFGARGVTPKEAV